MSDLSVTVAGRSYPFVSPGEMTLGEHRELKRISGMTPGDAELGLKKADPDAWAGVLLVSMRRVDPAARDDAVEDVNTVELMMAMEPSGPDDADPPTEATAASSARPSSRATTRKGSGR